MSLTFSQLPLSALTPSLPSVAADPTNPTPQQLPVRRFLTLFALGALSVGTFVGIFSCLGDAWDFDECWRLDRQRGHGHPVEVPEWCEPHGFEPSTPNPHRS